MDLAIAAEEIGIDGTYFRTHHFTNQLASPFPMLAVIGPRINKIEIGTGVIDMRYENPVYILENAGAADLISNSRLQLGISRGSPEQVIDRWHYFGYETAKGKTDADMGRHKGLEFLEKLNGIGFAKLNSNLMFPNPPGLLQLEPYSPGLHNQIWQGAGSNATAVWVTENGMNLQSSTLKDDENGKPFHIQQAEQIRLYREVWKKPDIKESRGSR